MDRRTFLHRAGAAGLAVFSGERWLLHPLAASEREIPLASPDWVPRDLVLSDEASGWLAHLWRKVGFGGTWHKHDEPHPSWDATSFAPAMGNRRYELTWLAWSLGLMAAVTPAWPEVYAAILRFSGDRFLEYWALRDWVEQRGADPDRTKYPDSYRALIPEGHFGHYDRPGWSANGSPPEAYDADPIRAGGSHNLMYKGYLNFVLSMYRYVSGDTHYENGFEVVYDQERRWKYDHRRLNELLSEQWKANPAGISCEVSKIYPWCNTLSGLGVRLYDLQHGTAFAEPHRRWTAGFSQRYLSRGDDGAIERLAVYYDPRLDVLLGGPQHQTGMNWTATIWHGIAVDLEVYRPLYDALIRRFYTPQPDGTAFIAAVPSGPDHNVATGLGAALAREMGDDARYRALRARVEQYYQPVWDRESGEFSFGFGLGEPWPRGQYNAWVMPGFVLTQPGQWRALFAERARRDYRAPVFCGIEFPRVLVRQAYWGAAQRSLFGRFTVGDDGGAARSATVVAANLDPGRPYRQVIDGGAPQVRAAAGGRLEVALHVGSHTVLLTAV